MPTLISLKYISIENFLRKLILNPIKLLKFNSSSSHKNEKCSNTTGSNNFQATFLHSDNCHLNCSNDLSSISSLSNCKTSIVNQQSERRSCSKKFIVKCTLIALILLIILAQTIWSIWYLWWRKNDANIIDKNNPYKTLITVLLILSDLYLFYHFIKLLIKLFKSSNLIRNAFWRRNEDNNRSTNEQIACPANQLPLNSIALVSNYFDVNRKPTTIPPPAWKRRQSTIIPTINVKLAVDDADEQIKYIDSISISSNENQLKHLPSLSSTRSSSVDFNGKKINIEQPRCQLQQQQIFHSSDESLETELTKYYRDDYLP